MKVSTPARKYPPANYCIYCGDTLSKLTTEHIIPFGLGGNLELPLSSCLECNKCTCRAETRCLQGMLGNLRARLDFPTRSKAHPQLLRLDVLDHDSPHFASLLVPAPTSPRFLFLWKLSPPGTYEGRSDADFDRMGPWFGGHKEDAHFLASYRAISSTPYRHMSFCRMLAKIGYSYAAAEWGSEFVEFEPLVTDLIREREGVLPYRYVGSDRVVPPEQPQTLHSIRGHTRSFEGFQYLNVVIRLFSFMGAPIYYVVAARRPDPKPKAPNSRPLKSWVRVSRTSSLSSSTPFSTSASTTMERLVKMSRKPHVDEREPIASKRGKVTKSAKG